MGLLETAEVWLRSQRGNSLAKPITYNRAGATAHINITGTQAETRFEVDNGEVIVDASMIDWIVEIADLMLDFGAGPIAIVPQGGDVITCPTNHGNSVFEVAAIGNEPEWQWHGRSSDSIRIHTVQTGTNLGVL